MMFVLYLNKAFGARIGGSSTIFANRYEIDGMAPRGPDPIKLLPSPWAPNRFGITVGYEIGNKVPRGPNPIILPPSQWVEN